MSVALYSLAKSLILKIQLITIILFFLIFFKNQLYSLPTGNDFIRFSPTSSSYDFITLESSFTTQPGLVVFGVVADYAHNVLPVIVQPGIDIITSEDSILTIHNHAAWGISTNLEGYVRFPVIAYTKSLDHVSNKGQINQNGLSYLAFGIKNGFFKQGYYEAAAGLELGMDLMYGNPHVGYIIPFVVNSYVALLGDYDPLLVGVNLGYRFRTIGKAVFDDKTNNIPIQPSAHSIYFGCGLTARSSKFGNLVFELLGSHIFQNQATAADTINTDRTNTPVELNIAYFYAFKIGLGIKAGIGKDMIRGVGSAYFRYFAGVDYILNLDNSLYANYKNNN